jgi:hypothetical protein
LSVEANNVLEVARPKLTEHASALDGQVAFADRAQPDSGRIGLFVHVIDDPFGMAN